MSGAGMTPEVREAELRLEKALAGAQRTLAEVDQFQQDNPVSGLDRARIDEIEQLVRAGKAPPEVVALQERIDAGELTWEDIAGGRNLDDEAVRRALGAGVQAMARAKELLDEGHDLESIIDADPGKAGTDHVDDDEPPDSFLVSGRW